MDVFWFIPFLAVGLAFLWGFYAYIKKQPLTRGAPRVLLDKTVDQQQMDQAAKSRDWSGRPCGSFLDWLSGRGE